MIRQIVGEAAEFFSVGICCLLVGVGVGIFQGWLSFLGGVLAGEYGILLGVWGGPITTFGGMTGGTFGLVLGLLLYTIFFRFRRKKLDFQIFSRIVSIAALAGFGSALVVGYLTKGEGVIATIPATVLATIFATIKHRNSEPVQSKNRLIFATIVFVMVGSGISFVQSWVSFTLFLKQLTMAAAFAGGAASALLGVFLYLKLFRKGFLFVPFCQIVSVAFLTGIAASLLLWKIAPGSESAAWISLMVPPFVALVLSWHFRPRQTVATV